MIKLEAGFEFISRKKNTVFRLNLLLYLLLLYL